MHQKQPFLLRNSTSRIKLDRYSSTNKIKHQQIENILNLDLSIQALQSREKMLNFLEFLLAIKKEIEILHLYRQEKEIDQGLAYKLF